MAKTHDTPEAMATWANDLGPAAYLAIEWWEKVMAEKYPGTPSLVKVISELKELEDNPANQEEAADVFIAFVIYCHRARINLGHAAVRKMGINRARNWGEPDANGEVHHV